MSLLAWVTGLSSPGQQIGFDSVPSVGRLRSRSSLRGPKAALEGSQSRAVAASSAALALPRLLPMLGYANRPGRRTLPE